MTILRAKPLNNLTSWQRCFIRYRTSGTQQGIRRFQSIVPAIHRSEDRQGEQGAVKVPGPSLSPKILGTYNPAANNGVTLWGSPQELNPVIKCPGRNRYCLW